MVESERVGRDALHLGTDITEALTYCLCQTSNFTPIGQAVTPEIRLGSGLPDQPGSGFRDKEYQKIVSRYTMVHQGWVC